MPLYVDKEKTKRTINLVLDKIRTEADPLLLDEYHRLFKKEVSLFHRSKVAAYLLMQNDQGKNFRRAGNDRHFTPENTPASKEPTRYPLSSEESKWLFFSAGRSRRVFPREILGLINTKTAIPREDIGAIRILDNYSFVQVRDTIAEKIIAALNGLVFRGRPLTVNYAKSRKNEDETEAAADAEADAYEDDYAELEQDEDHSEEENI
jgi:hypothetical protein